MTKPANSYRRDWCRCLKCDTLHYGFVNTALDRRRGDGVYEVDCPTCQHINSSLKGEKTRSFFEGAIQ